VVSLFVSEQVQQVTFFVDKLLELGDDILGRQQVYYSYMID
jgi:hypothetical protein